MDPLEAVALEGSEKFTYVSTLLSSEEKEQLRRVLLGNADVFIWSHLDMAGISLTLASHKLNIIATTKPVRQKIRRFHPNRHQIIQTEVDNLLSVGFIREVKYHEWLANVVVVPKKGGKWWVYVDYKDLNEACPKDSFPLPRIDKIVDASLGMGCCHFWTPSLAITRFQCTRLMQTKRPSLHRMSYTAIVRFLLAIKHTYIAEKLKFFPFSNSTKDPCDPIR